MAEVMKFDLVAPQRRLASAEVAAVRLPGSEGEMTVMPGHEPLVTSLRPGIVRVEGPAGESEYVVIGGFAEISQEQVTILAEQAFDRSGVSRAEIEALLREAEERREAAEAEERDLAEAIVADLAHLLEMME